MTVSFGSAFVSLPCKYIVQLNRNHLLAYANYMCDLSRNLANLLCFYILVSFEFFCLYTGYSDSIYFTFFFYNLINTFVLPFNCVKSLHFDHADFWKFLKKESITDMVKSPFMHLSLVPFLFFPRGVYSSGFKLFIARQQNKLAFHLLRDLEVLWGKKTHGHILTCRFVIYIGSTEGSQTWKKKKPVNF